MNRHNMTQQLFGGAALAALALATAPALAIDANASKSSANSTVMAASNNGAASGGKFGIFGCQSDGNKQVGVAVIGGLLGGFLGNRIAGRGSRTLGTVLGGAMGAAAGSALGCKLQKNDQAKAETAMEEALAKGENQTWQSDETGASGKVEVTDGASAAGLANLKLASGVDPADGYAKVGKAFVTTSSANVRSAPTLGAKIVGRLPVQTRVWVPASVEGAPWYLISDNGIGQGYVSNALLKPAAVQSAANSCKMVKQTIDVPGSGPASETYQACKGADGGWAMTRV